MGVAGLIHGPDTGHLSEYGGRDDEDVAPREHEAAVLKKNLRENFEEAKFETGKLRNHYPPPSVVPFVIINGGAESGARYCSA